ncbi:hypothetical protein Mapa_000326 [Marchantia paleacea]|nr:hypothetical protein Mapa_000326 [Marchantia paleacea]
MASSESTSNSETSEGTERKPLMMIRNVLTMVRGDGEDSYARNSSYQLAINNTAYSILSPCIQQLNLPAPDTGPFVISDLGCSSGPNTVKIVSDVVKMLKLEYQMRGRDEPEFQAYFNDLPSTDFNVLFEILASDSREFFYAGVPGSFYDRIVHKSSVHVFLSTNTLHWISQVQCRRPSLLKIDEGIPPEVAEENSAAYNKDRVWLHDSNIHVINAYRRQAVDDMKSFLDARGEELISGGLLFCIFASASEEIGDSREIWLTPLSEDKESTQISFMRILDYAWDELISENFLTGEQRARCNIPWFKLSMEELGDILKTYEDIFKVEVFRTLPMPVSNFPTIEELDSTMRSFNAAYEPFFSSILGSELTFTLFSRLGKLFVEKVQLGALASAYTSHVLALVRV